MRYAVLLAAVLLGCSAKEEKIPEKIVIEFKLPEDSPEVKADKEAIKQASAEHSRLLMEQTVIDIRGPTEEEKAALAEWENLSKQYLRRLNDPEFARYFVERVKGKKVTELAPK